MGWFHRDQPYRDSAALDVLEAIRPAIDSFAIDLFESRTFSKREFVESSRGQVLLAPSLARGLADATLHVWQHEVGPIVEELARLLGEHATSPVRVRTRLTQADRRKGRTPAVGRSKPKVPPACRTCGLILDDPERSVCDECLPQLDQERTAKLSAAGKATLAAMRALGDADPAHSTEARAKRAASSAKAVSANRDWERRHGRSLRHRDVRSETSFRASGR